MAIPKEVRQRMINVMYVVLLALLALQIPKEVTQAFITINKGIETSSASLDYIIKNNIYDLEKKAKNGDKMANYYAIKSNEISSLSNELTAYIDGIKSKITSTIGVDENGKIKIPEETVLTNELLIKGDENGINDGLAFELKQKLITTNNQMLELMPRDSLELIRTGYYEDMVSSLPTTSLMQDKEDFDFANWETGTFEQMPAAGAITMLSKIQSDFKSSENKLIDELKSLVQGPTPTNLSAQVVAPSSYVLRGEKFTADLFLSTYSSRADNMTIVANGRKYKPGPDGITTFTADANTTGQKSLTGHIEVKNTSTGKVAKYPFKEFKYTVAEPYATVSPNKMNVFYIGVKNPISASAAGVLPKDLRLSIDKGQVGGTHGEYDVIVNKQGTANVIVSDKNGKVHGQFPFRVKRVPDPEAQLNNKPGGSIDAATFKVQKGLNIKLNNFEFEMKFDVVSYKMVYIPSRKPLGITSSESANFSPNMLAHISQAKPGDIYAFEEIQVRGEDKQLRNIQGINFRIK